MTGQEFCRWWRENVRRAGQPSESIIADTAIILTAEQAEHHTGIAPHQVSRWNKNLKKRPKARQEASGAGKARDKVGAALGVSGHP